MREQCDNRDDRHGRDQRGDGLGFAKHLQRVEFVPSARGHVTLR